MQVNYKGVRCMKNKVDISKELHSQRSYQNPSVEKHLPRDKYFALKVPGKEKPEKSLSALSYLNPKTMWNLLNLRIMKEASDAEKKSQKLKVRMQKFAERIDEILKLANKQNYSPEVENIFIDEGKARKRIMQLRKDNSKVKGVSEKLEKTTYVKKTNKAVTWITTFLSIAIAALSASNFFIDLIEVKWTIAALGALLTVLSPYKEKISKAASRVRSFKKHGIVKRKANNVDLDQYENFLSFFLEHMKKDKSGNSFMTRKSLCSKDFQDKLNEFSAKQGKVFSLSIKNNKSSAKYNKMIKKYALQDDTRIDMGNSQDKQPGNDSPTIK